MRNLTQMELEKTYDQYDVYFDTQAEFKGIESEQSVK